MLGKLLLAGSFIAAVVSRKRSNKFASRSSSRGNSFTGDIGCNSLS